MFEDILSCVGRKAKDVKSKCVIKVHTVINTDTKVPSLVWFSPATTYDHNFLDKVEYDENTVYVFDKRCTDYKAFKHFTENKTGFVTLIKDNAI